MNSEAVDSISSLSARQQDTERQQAQNARAEVEMNKMAAVRKKQKDAADRESLKSEIKREIQSNSFEPDGDSIEEKTRYAKETGINFRKQKPQPEGGSAKDDKAFQHVSKMMRSMSGGRPAGQRPKVKGKKPPTAGQYGAPQSPAQKVAKRRADAKRAQDNMSSRFD